MDGTALVVWDPSYRVDAPYEVDEADRVVRFDVGRFALLGRGVVTYDEAGRPLSISSDGGAECGGAAFIHVAWTYGVEGAPLTYDYEAIAGRGTHRDPDRHQTTITSVSDGGTRRFVVSDACTFVPTRATFAGYLTPRPGVDPRDTSVFMGDDFTPDLPLPPRYGCGGGC